MQHIGQLSVHDLVIKNRNSVSNITGFVLRAINNEGEARWLPSMEGEEIRIFFYTVDPSSSNQYYRQTPTSGYNASATDFQDMRVPPKITGDTGFVINDLIVVNYIEEDSYSEEDRLHDLFLLREFNGSDAIWVELGRGYAITDEIDSNLPKRKILKFKGIVEVEDNNMANEIVVDIGHKIQEEGDDTYIPDRFYLNFKGNGVIVEDNEYDNSTDVTIQDTFHKIQEDGDDTYLPQREHLNFKGSGVSVEDNEGNNSTDVTIEPGASDVGLDEDPFENFLEGKGIDDVQKLANELDAAVGREDGIASLDSYGRLPLEQLPITAMEYKGVWNADANDPHLENGHESHTNGDVYLCTTAGTTNFGAGDISFLEGDWAVYNGSIWERSVNSENYYTNSDPSINEVGGILPGSTFHLETMQDMFKWMLYEEYPVLIEPTYTLNWSIDGSPVSDNESLQEVGEDINLVFTSSFNRGLIDSSAWGSGSEDRSGAVTQHEFSGIIDDTVFDNVDSVEKIENDYTVVEGEQEQTTEVTFEDGIQPKSKFDRDYQSFYPGGSMNKTVTIVGVYPVFATSENINTLDKQELLKHGEDVIVELVAEVGIDKQTIDIPKFGGWDSHASTIYQWNPISSQWDEIGLTNFTIQDLADPHEYGINYYSYMHNGSLIGARKLRFSFS